MKLNRRKFVLSGSAAILAGGAWLTFSRYTSLLVQNASAILARLLPKPDAAVTLGKLIVASYRPESDKVVAFLEKQEGLISREGLQNYVSESIKNDYTRGAFIEVEGWLLSETEANIYARVAKD